MSNNSLLNVIFTMASGKKIQKICHSTTEKAVPGYLNIGLANEGKIQHLNMKCTAGGQQAVTFQNFKGRIFWKSEWLFNC